jgi:hypothetical protein
VWPKIPQGGEQALHGSEANRPNMSDLTNKMTGIHDMMRAGEPGTSLMKTSNDAQGSRSSRWASKQCEVRGNSLDTTTVYPRMMATFQEYLNNFHRYRSKEY